MQERVGGGVGAMAVPKKGEGWVPKRSKARKGPGVREAGQGLGGGARASVPGGVSGRGTGPRDGANFATGVVFLSFLTRTKRRKMLKIEGCPVGWGGTEPGAGLVNGVDQGP